MDTNLEIISGQLKKLDAIDTHLQKEYQRDFGLPICVYKVKRMIVELRRKENTDWGKFEEYLDRYKKIIIPNLNMRWTCSVLDTLADAPNDPETMLPSPRKINATWLSAIYKQSLITDSLFLHLTNWEINHNNILEKLPLTPDPHFPDKPGMFGKPKPIPRLKNQRTVTNMQTDILKNVSTRINSVVERDELLKELQSHLRLIYDEADTLIGLWRKLEYEG